MKTMNRGEFLKGAVDAAPNYLVHMLLFSATGMLAKQHELSLIQLITMTGSIFASPMQAFIIENSHLSYWSLAMNCILINFKFGFMSAALLSFFKYPLHILMGILFFITSSIFLLASGNMVQRNVSSPLSYYLGVALPSYSIAIISSICGYILAEHTKEYQSFLSMLGHMVLPLYFICLTVRRYKEVRIIIATLLGFLLTPMLLEIMRKECLVLVWFAIALILIFTERRECGKQS